MIYAYLFLSAILNGVAQLLWKIGLNGIQGFSIFQILLNKYVIAGFFLYGISIILWFYVLSKLDVSFAYPFIALSFVIVSLGGYYMGDNFNIFKILGILFILLGIVLIFKFGK